IGSYMSRSGHREDGALRIADDRDGDRIRRGRQRCRVSSADYLRGRVADGRRHLEGEASHTRGGDDSSSKCTGLAGGYRLRPGGAASRAATTTASGTATEVDLEELHACISRYSASERGEGRTPKLVYDDQVDV